MAIIPAHIEQRLIEISSCVEDRDIHKLVPSARALIGVLDDLSADPSFTIYPDTPNYITLEWYGGRLRCEICMQEEPCAIVTCDEESRVRCREMDMSDPVLVADRIRKYRDTMYRDTMYRDTMYQLVAVRNVDSHDDPI